jgi:hypothetical protein
MNLAIFLCVYILYMHLTIFLSNRFSRPNYDINLIITITWNPVLTVVTVGKVMMTVMKVVL